MKKINLDIGLSKTQEILGTIFLKAYKFNTILSINQDIVNIYHDIFSGFYDLFTNLFLPEYNTIIKIIKEEFIQKEYKVLDLCCGTGNISLEIGRIIKMNFNSILHEIIM